MSDAENTQQAYMSRGEYARHRGVSAPTITQFGHEGRLIETADGKINVAETDALLATSLDPARGGDRTDKGLHPNSTNAADYLAAKTRRELAMAAKAGLEAEHLAGRLVSVEEVEREAFTAARQAQESLLAIPDRLASMLAAESDPAKTHQLLSDEIRRVVSAIAGDDKDQP